MACYFFRMEVGGENPLKSVGRARGRRRLNVCGPATIPACGPLEPVPGFSKSSSEVKVKLFLSTPLRHMRKWMYSSTHS